MKLDAALSGVKLYVKNKKFDAIILNCGPTTLKTILEAIKEHEEHPLNITGLIAQLRFKGLNVMRGPIDIDLSILELAGAIKCDATWRETLIKPLYNKVSVTVDEDGRTVVKLD